MQDIGFCFTRENIQIYYADIPVDESFSYNKVTIEEGITAPNWEDVDSNWFNKQWDSIQYQDDESYIFYESNQSYNAFVKVKEILKKANRKLQIIDSYVDNNLYELLNQLNTDVRIEILTSKVQDGSTIWYEKLKKQRGQLETKITKKVHDRFIILDESKVYLLGTSINSIGNKASTIVQIESPEVSQSIVGHFKKLWLGSRQI